jgi:hypothetical protein
VNVLTLWKGAVEPNDLGTASGNEIIMAKGAVQPTRSYTAVVTARAKGGRVKRKSKRRQRRLFVEIDEKVFFVNSPDEAVEILSQAAEMAEEVAKDETKVIRKPRVRVVTRSGSVSKSKVIRRALKLFENRIGNLIDSGLVEQKRQRAINREISQLLQTKLTHEAQQEEELLLLLLL